MARSSSRAGTCGDPSANRKATRHPILNDGTGHGACQQVTVTNIVSLLQMFFWMQPRSCLIDTYRR